MIEFLLYSRWKDGVGLPGAKFALFIGAQIRICSDTFGRSPESRYPSLGECGRTAIIQSRRNEPFKANKLMSTHRRFL